MQVQFPYRRFTGLPEQAQHELWRDFQTLASYIERPVELFPNINLNTNAPSGYWSGIAFGAGTFVAVASSSNPGTFNLIMYSKDGGTTWTVSVIGVDSPNSFKNVVYANGLFIAVGSDTTSGDGIVWSSPDGVVWTPMANVPAALDGNPFLLDVAVSPSGIIVVNSADTCYRSINNGSTWEVGFFLPPAAAPDHPGLIYAEDLFVWVGYYSGFTSVYKSPSGASGSWTDTSTPTVGKLTDVAYGNGIFLSTQRTPGALLISTDGNTWTATGTTLTEDCIKYIEFCKDRFFISNDNKTVLYSTFDGTDMTSYSGLPAYEWRHIAYGDGVVLIVERSHPASPSTIIKLGSYSPEEGPGSISIGDLGPNSVGTAQIVDGAVTTAKLAAGAVTTAKLADGAVTAAKVAPDVATQAELDAEAALARNADNLTSGTVADARIPATIARDSEVTTAVSDHAAAADPHTGYQKESEKNAQNGYAGLDNDANARVPAARLATGTPDGTKFLRDDRTWVLPPTADETLFWTNVSP